jgi:hypothetical protein
VEREREREADYTVSESKLKTPFEDRENMKD